MKYIFFFICLLALSTSSLSQGEEIIPPRYMPNQAIVKLNWKFLDLAAIDDKETYSGSIYDFLNTNGLDYLK